MNNMYKKIIKSSVVLAVVVFSTAVVSAGTNFTFSTTLTSPLGSRTTLLSLMEAIVSVFVQVGMPVVALAIIYSGFLFVSSQGSEEKIKKAKNAFFYTIIGAIVLLGASVIGTMMKNTIDTIGAVPQTQTTQTP